MLRVFLGYDTDNQETWVRFSERAQMCLGEVRSFHRGTMKITFP
jgi:hypothetical protein